MADRGSRSKLPLTELETSAGVGSDDFRPEFAFRQFEKRVAGTMQRHEIVGVNLLYGRQGLSQILWRVWREVKAADDRMHLLDAGDLLRLSDRIDDPSVTARRENNQPAVLEIEGGCDLMVELVE